MVIDQLIVKNGADLLPVDSCENKTIDKIIYKGREYHFAKQADIQGTTELIAENAVNEPIRSLEIQGNTIQDGTPTVEAPVDIVNAGDNGLTLELRGKNLFDLNNALIGSNWYYIGGTISYPLNLTIGKQYTISANTLVLKSDANYSCNLVRKTGDTVFAATNLFAMANSLGEKEYTFTADGTEYLWGYRDGLMGSTAIQNYINKMLLEYVEDIQIEQGSTATEYEAYFNTAIAIPPSVTVGSSTIPLRFARVDDKADYIEVNRLDGTVKYMRNIAYLKMPYASGVYSFSNGYYYGVQFSDKSEQRMTRAKGICTHSNYVGNYQNNSTDNAIWVGVSSTYIYWIGVLDILGFRDLPTKEEQLTAFNTWLDEQEAQGTPVELIYQLKTPVTRDITNTDLGQALLALQTQDGTNIITITSDNIDISSSKVSYWQQI